MRGEHAVVCALACTPQVNPAPASWAKLHSLAARPYAASVYRRAGLPYNRTRLISELPSRYGLLT